MRSIEQQTSACPERAPSISGVLTLLEFFRKPWPKRAVLTFIQCMSRDVSVARSAEVVGVKFTTADGAESPPNELFTITVSKRVP